MTTITIGAVTKSLQESEESWINQEIRRQEAAAGQLPCVRVRVQDSGVDLVLSSGPCGGGAGGGRVPNEREYRIFQLWEKHGLQGGPPVGGKLVAFLKQLVRLL
jgi:hypothetical protein